MLQSAIVMSQTAQVSSKAMGAGANTRPAPAVQDTRKTEAKTPGDFSTELNSTDLSQTHPPITEFTDDVEQLPRAGEDVNQQTAKDTATAEEWILNMLGQQTTQLQARDLAQTHAGEVQELPITFPSTVNTTDKATESKRLLDQQTLLTLNQSAHQKQTQAQPTLVITNTGDNNNGQAANNGQVVDSSNDPTQHFSTNVLPVVERAVNQTVDQTVDQTKSAITNVLADRLSGIAPAQNHEDAVSSISNATNQTLIDTVPERTLKLHGTEAKWGEQMLQTLRENVGLQLQHRQQNATIRLDPPELGSMEIFLSHESGRLTVQISASQGDVARLLQQTSDRLRQELVNQQFVQVNVQISNDNHGGQRHSQQHSAQWNEEQITKNHQGDDAAPSGKSTTHNDILVTV